MLRLIGYIKSNRMNLEKNVRNASNRHELSVLPRVCSAATTFSPSYKTRVAQRARNHVRGRSSFSRNARHARRLEDQPDQVMTSRQDGNGAPTDQDLGVIHEVTCAKLGTKKTHKRWLSHDFSEERNIWNCHTFVLWRPSREGTKRMCTSSSDLHTAKHE